MSHRTPSTKTRSTEIATEARASESHDAPNQSSKLDGQIKQPVIGSKKSTKKPVLVSAPEGLTSTTPSGTSDPIIKTRNAVLTEENEAQLTPEMHSLFRSIGTGEQAFFDLVPSKRVEQNRHGLNLNVVHPKTLHTPLTMALQNKQFEIAAMLLVLGADPLVLNSQGKLPSDYATPLCRMVLRFFYLRGQPEVRIENAEPRKRFLQLLNALDNDSGETMLSWALMQRQDKMAALLISDGADYASRNAKGAAPLEVAARYGSMQLVDAMLEVWPQLASRPKLPYLKQAIIGAVEMNRPALLAHLLRFFRAEFRANEADENNDDIDSIDLHEKIPPNPETEDDAFEFQKNAKLQSPLTVSQLMQRSSDSYLLTEKECWLLGLEKAELLAKEMGHQRVLDIFAAHTKARV